MADIVRTLEQPAPSASSAGGSPGRSEERLSASYVVQIGGKNLADEFLSQRISSIVVEETARGLSKATIKILNENLAFTDNALLQGGNLEVEVFTGYSATTLISRGKFVAAVPRYAFRNQAMPLVTLECYGEEWLLHQNEEREIYENLKDSQIAEKIARRNGLEADVEPTAVKYEHVAQFGMTDIEFLENRALLYGYDVFVEEGVLHFHPPRFEESNLVLIYGRGETGILNSFEVAVDPWVMGSSWTKAGIDPITGNEWEVRSDDSPNDLVKQIQRRGGAGFQTAADLATGESSRPRRFIFGDGHLQTEGEAKEQVKGYAQATEWVAVGSAHVVGIERMKARQVVKIDGAGHLSGDYYVSRVTHKIVAGQGYRMHFVVTRPGVGRLEDRFVGGGGSNRRDVTAQSAQAGEASVV